MEAIPRITTTTTRHSTPQVRVAADSTGLLAPTAEGCMQYVTPYEKLTHDCLMTGAAAGQGFRPRGEPAREHARPVNSTTGMATAAAQAPSGGQSVEMCGQASASADASGAREEEAALSGHSSGSPCDDGAGRGAPRRRRSLAAAAQARLLASLKQCLMRIFSMPLQLHGPEVTALIVSHIACRARRRRQQMWAAQTPPAHMRGSWAAAARRARWASLRGCVRGMRRGRAWLRTGRALVMGRRESAIMRLAGQRAWGRRRWRTTSLLQWMRRRPATAQRWGSCSPPAAAKLPACSPAGSTAAAASRRCPMAAMRTAWSSSSRMQGRPGWGRAQMAGTCCLKRHCRRQATRSVRQGMRLRRARQRRPPPPT